MQQSSASGSENSSVFQGNMPLEAKLEKARMELLDLGARNRLLNMPRGGKSAKSLEIVDELTSEIYRLLVRETRAFTFLAGRQATPADVAEDPDEVFFNVPVLEDELTDARGFAARHVDTKLQTRLTEAGLQKRLLDLYHDARTLEEEQGVNILFLALGSLKWIDPTNSENVRFAPLILVPVALDRGNAAERFKLRWRGEDLASNLSLEAFLDRLHGIKLPAFEGGDDFDPIGYIRSCAKAVEAKPGWAVAADDIVLGFFSFAKFLMYRDLDPANWPKDAKLSDHDIIRALVSDGFDADVPLIDEDVRIDAHIPPSDMVHIVDSDSSQTLAVHEVRRGRNLVIQGPPGTGKSQTIANVIGAAVADGKTVLFVAEKMAALEVVKRRLDRTGVGDVCLELHSNKANKRAVLAELSRTWELGTPKGSETGPLNARLIEARDALNAHADRLHQTLGSAGYTPYQVIGHLTRLRQAGQQPNDIKLEQPAEWSREDLHNRSTILAELIERVKDIGVPAAHPWRGVGLASALPADVDRLVMRVERLIASLSGIVEDNRRIAERLELQALATLDDLQALTALADRLGGAPDLTAEALGADIWTAEREALHSLIDKGERLTSLRRSIAAAFKPEAWETDVGAARDALAALPDAMPLAAFDAAALIADGAPRLIEEGQHLVVALGRAEPAADLRTLDEMARVAERVASAPNADPQAFAASIWDSGIERAADLAAMVAALEAAKARVGNGLSDSAWQADLGDSRRVLAAHGTGFFKLFSSEWRAANRLVRSYLTDPKAPLDRQLTLLDALGRGRSALQTIQSENGFGQEAFGSAWRGERTISAPLIVLVEWMRSLRGLGAEPRLVASRGPDRARLAALGSSITSLHARIEPAVAKLWRDTGNARQLMFGTAIDHISAPLGEISTGAAALDTAHKQYSALAFVVPPELPARRQALADLVEGRNLRSELASSAAQGAAAFGPRWRGEDSDWPYLRFAARWIGDNLDIYQLAARITDRGALHQRALASETRVNAFLVELQVLLTDLKAGETALISLPQAKTGETENLAAALTTWRAEGELLSKWVAYQNRAERASALGLTDLVQRLDAGSLTPELAEAHFEMSYFEAVFADQVQREPELAQFDGQLHERIVRSFADLDLQRIKQSALDVVRAHHRRIPPPSGGKVGPLGVLRGEIARKRGHMPIRKLMQQAAPAVQALKPVFMMSPLSVAQFLEPGALTFDLLVMDEASQIQPVDALGAIARCRQVVVVGDPKQLPPTAFFSKMVGNTDGDGDDDDGGTRVADIESILGLFTARGLPTRMLRWHYRSRHQSLIAVSNKQFYENKLFIVPSPYLAESGLGLRFHKVDGIFETGSTRTNPIEAKRVAQAIVSHAITHPEQSLGVVAFSAAQRRAIQNELEMLRKALPTEQEAFFQAHIAEPFFIKNLENVQGDERDVIFISVGYGPTAPGLKPPMRFGPVGSEGGERRLNVLISRAKQRCEVFASMTDEDIDADFAASRKGVFALKLFMHFARTGKMSLAEANARDLDSVFEEQVQEALQARGYKVDQQVGLAGFFIDLAVADPDRADRYLIGIECDGVAYHEARSARDRDRLRQAILEDHGWIIHRIWSTDWFKRPKAELERLVSAIEAAEVELAARGEHAAKKRAGRLEIFSVEREDVTEMGLSVVETREAATTPYVEAVLTQPHHLHCELHETPTGILTQLAEQVVGIEGPVHIGEIVSRIREAWGLQRSGARIQDSVGKAIEVAVRQHRLEKSGAFYSVPGSDVVVRDRSNAQSPSLRKPECLPPAEIRAAVLAIVGRNFGATDEQAVQAASRAFGFKATSAQLRDVMSGVIASMLAQEELVRRDTLIELGPNAPAATGPTKEPTPIERLIGMGEGETIEFKETLRWDIRQREVNKKLEEVVVKTIAAFGNHKGGTLLIGVADDGSVTGIESDVRCTGGNLDKYELHINAILGANFPSAFRASKVKVTFPVVGPHQVCRIDVEKSRWALYVKTADRAGAIAERLFVRMGNSSQEIPPSQLVAYVNDHFCE